MQLLHGSGRSLCAEKPCHRVRETKNSQYVLPQKATAVCSVGKKACYPKAQMPNFSVVTSSQHRVVGERWTTTSIQLIPRVTWTTYSLSQNREVKSKQKLKEKVQILDCASMQREKGSQL